MSHAHPDCPVLPSGDAAPEKGRAVSVGSGALFGEGEAEAWVKKLDQMDNEQLADVLGFVMGKLCKNRQ